jgi:hypothetical protein
MSAQIVITKHRKCGFILTPVIASLLLLSAGAAFATCTENDSDPYGSLLNADEFNQAVHALPPAAFLPGRVQPPLPPNVYLSNLPAVSQQGTAAPPGLGSPGSCEAQSFGYGLGSYTAARRPDGVPRWPARLPENSISAAYLFSWGMFTGFAQCPQGGLALQYLNHLVGIGAPTRARIPYQPDCSYFSAIQQHGNFPNNYPDMKRFRIGSYAGFSVANNPQALQLIKQYIANGQAVAFSGHVLCGYGTNLPMQDGVIYETSLQLGQNGQPIGHGQLVVGYDDNVGTAGNQGALLIQNSFGTGWPTSVGAISSIAPPGMAYWSYNSFLQTQQLAAVAYPRAAGPPAGVRLSGNGHAPRASITSAFQWAPDGPSPKTYLILTHFFQEPVSLSHISLTEPGGQAITATGGYGQNISTGYTYLLRTDGNAFLIGRWHVFIEGNDMNGNPVSYSGSIQVGQPEPNSPPGASMAGVPVTDSTGACATSCP